MTEFFLKRYRQISPQVVIVEPESLKQAIRVHDEKVVEELKKKGVNLEKIPWLQKGWWASSEFSLGSTKEYLLGKYYIQAPLSQLTCEILSPDAEVLDMAAAPGSKATYLASMIPKNFVLALDVDPARLESVRNNAERMGLPNIICMRKDARFAFDIEKEFPFVLLDAPCSGNFCSEKNWCDKRKMQDIEKNARMQKELFKSAYKCLSPGGRLLYSTCSLEPEEDECIISWALDRYTDLEIQEIKSPIGDPGVTEWNGESLNKEVAKTRRFWPHKTGCEGFYIALMVKK